MTERAEESARPTFEQTLDDVHRRAGELGALVLENTRRLADAMLENDLDKAQQVIDADVEIDELYVELEHAVFEILARQQPMAGDLRFLVSITRILYEIERSGDLAVNAAKGMVVRHGYTPPRHIHGLMARMTDGAIDLFGKGLDALADQDPTAGPRLDAEDDVVDDLVGELYAAIAQESSDLGFDLAVELSRVARYMERIADHAVNIAEHVTFIVTGAFPEEGSVATKDDGP